MEKTLLNFHVVFTEAYCMYSAILYMNVKEQLDIVH